MALRFLPGPGSVIQNWYLKGLIKNAYWLKCEFWSLKFTFQVVICYSVLSAIYKC